MARTYYRTIWISDIHLGYKDCKAEYLQNFLKEVECDTLYLVGDIVDIISMKRKFMWPSAHYEVLKAIFKMAKKGTRIIYIPGNHDHPMRDYIEHMIGPVEVHEEFVHKTAQGKRLLLFHGDILDSRIRFGKYTKIIGDIAYDFLLFINRWSNYIRQRLGMPYFSLAYYIKNSVKNSREAIEVFERAAAYEAKRRRFDGVVCGHIHQAEVRVINGVLYCNDGDWVESCTALIEDKMGHLEIIHWSDRQKVLKKVSVEEQNRNINKERQSLRSIAE